MRALADELSTPKYAHVERERRWLVAPGARPSLDGLAHVQIDDRYIRGTRFRLRRMTDSLGGATSLKLTKKYDCADRLARPIVTAYLSETEYALFAGLAADPLTKRRFSLVDGGVEWSLDVFAGPLDGLELLESEAIEDAALAALKPPSWVIREVTADLRFDGGTLAIKGLPEEDIWQPS